MIKLQTPTNPLPIKIQILRCSDGMLWYSDLLGYVLIPFAEEEDMWWVRDKDGYSNYVLKRDCKIYNS